MYSLVQISAQAGINKRPVIKIRWLQCLLLSQDESNDSLNSGLFIGENLRRGLMKEKLFLIASLLTIIAGALLFVVALSQESDSPFLVIMGLVVVFVGVLLMITGYITPTVAQSREGTGLAYLMLAASVIVIIGLFDIVALWMFPLIGGGLIFLSCIMWPCFCSSGKSKNRDKIIGVVNAHDSITMYDLSQRTGLSVDVVRDVIYNALSKGQLFGKMEGDTFVRGRPTAISPSAPGTTTKEREIIKVLVVCPFCGAKNEQGTPKCHNCSASL